MRDKSGGIRRRPDRLERVIQFDYDLINGEHEKMLLTLKKFVGKTGMVDSINAIGRLDWRDSIYDDDQKGNGVAESKPSP
ncbi:hypothetical protein Leryth_011928 [Lithospermum erythrorhizon]|nr:hypothetical protein Leryth_011928 [Lithospermum erythrorhizon]